MTYARFTDVKSGDTLIADDGFTCLRAGPVVVHKDADGLYIICDEGHHNLIGQLGECGRLIGLSKA